MSIEAETSVPSPAPAPRRSIAATAWIAVLAVLVAGLAVGGALLFLEIQRLQAASDASQLQINEQRRLIEEQGRLLDEKETFGAAMEDLMAMAKTLDGLPIGDLVAFDEIEAIARQAWERRESATDVAALTADVHARAETLRARIEAAEAQLASNASGTLGEAIIDELGAGHVRVVFDDPAPICGGDPIGCVSSDDPTLIHLDPSEFTAEYFDDTLRVLVANHEFAHVLQFTNPGPTATAALAFGDDWEFMADCVALTRTDSWSLDRRVWRDSASYWDVSVGYGRVCDDAQRDTIRTWLGEIGVRYRPVSQEAA